MFGRGSSPRTRVTVHRRTKSRMTCVPGAPLSMTMPATTSSCCGTSTTSSISSTSFSSSIGLDGGGREQSRSRSSVLALSPGIPSSRDLANSSLIERRRCFPRVSRSRSAHYDLGSRAWQAFRAADPLVLDAFVRGDTSALPFLAPALLRHLEEYPWTRDGLSRTERRILSLLQHGPMDIWNVFPALHADETAFYIADGSFWSIAEALATAQPALVSMDITSRTPGRLPAGSMR